MKLRPTLDCVVVKQEEAAGKTEGGIVLPEAAKMQLARGEIVAVGPGRTEAGYRNGIGLKVGERVIFEPAAVTEVEVDKDKLLIMREKAVLAVIESEDEKTA